MRFKLLASESKIMSPDYKPIILFPLPHIVATLQTTFSFFPLKTNTTLLAILL